MSDESSVAYGERARAALGFSRWWQVAAAVGMMAAVSPYQYVWSSVASPLSESLDVAPAALGAAFSFYVVFQSLSQFPAGRWRDRRGPGALTGLAALLAGGGYVAVNTAVKWFPDRTGLTTGLGTMAFAAGSVLAVPYVRANATVESYPAVLRNVGLVILVILLAGSVVLRDPPEGWLDVDDEAGVAASLRGATYTTREMARTWQFWLLYAMFVATAGADLIVIANVVTFAEELGFTDLIATVAATLLPLAAGGSRLVLGDVTDRLGRKPVMVASFLLAGLFRFGLVAAGRADLPVAFVALVLLAMFFSSPLYVYFPALLSDYYGSEFSSSNYAVLYTAKVGGGVVAGTVAGYLAAAVGWGLTFALGGALATGAGVAALALRPPEGSGLAAAAD